MKTRIGINGMMINIKRSNALKMYEGLKALEQSDDVSKKENIQNCSSALRRWLF